MLIRARAESAPPTTRARCRVAIAAPAFSALCLPSLRQPHVNFADARLVNRARVLADFEAHEAHAGAGVLAKAHALYVLALRQGDLRQRIIGRKNDRAAYPHGLENLAFGSRYRFERAKTFHVFFLNVR